MAEYTIDKIEYGGNVYKLQDNISGYITGTIPTKTSDLTNDSGFITASHTSTYSLPTAVYDTLGGIKPAYSTTGTATLTTSSQAYTNNPTIAARTTTSGKYYGVEIDSAGRLFVNVPWADTKVTTNALVSGTLYYPILATGANTATRHVDSTLKGLTYRSTAGTTSSVGTATLTLGNDIASGTANNERGQLFLYSTTNYYVKIQSEALSTNRTITLPNKSGTLAIESDITDKKLQVDSLTSGTMYYPILATGTGTATRQIDSTLNGLRYESISGTTSMAGSASLILGNDIAEGTVNNEDGQLVLYGPSGKYGMIVCNSTANRIVELPDQTGTLATTTDIYESVELTQLEYDALSSTDKSDPKKVYFVKDADPSETSELLDIMYPIGSYYETADINFDPNVKWGGYWISETLTDNKIVEEGKTNDWTYRKWSSGVAECWKRMTLASGAFTATGNIYYRSASGYSLPSGLFNAAPTIEVNAEMGNVGAASALSVTSSSFAIYTMSAVSTAREIIFSVYATGTWKTYEAPFPIYKWTRLD